MKIIPLAIVVQSAILKSRLFEDLILYRLIFGSHRSLDQCQSVNEVVAQEFGWVFHALHCLDERREMQLLVPFPGKVNRIDLHE
jgi:hypothetical protein